MALGSLPPVITSFPSSCIPRCPPCTSPALPQAGLRWLENSFPQQARGWVGFNVAMSHKMTAAADILLMPSRFEPCGLNQLYAMRYGTGEARVVRLAQPVWVWWGGMTYTEAGTVESGEEPSEWWSSDAAWTAACGMFL